MASGWLASSFSMSFSVTPALSLALPDQHGRLATCEGCDGLDGPGLKCTSRRAVRKLDRQKPTESWKDFEPRQEPIWTKFSWARARVRVEAHLARDLRPRAKGEVAGDGRGE